MPEHDPRADPRPAPRSRRRTAGRCARTRSSSTTAASTSSRGCPSAARAASRCCSSTASSPARGSGSATSATSPVAAGRATRSTCATTTGRGRPIRRRCRSTPTPRTSSRRSSGSARRRSWSATAWAACSRSRPPSGCRSRASSCSARSCRATCGRPPGRTSCARSPRSTASRVIGWETLPEKLLRDDRDLTLADVLRIQHLLGQKPHEAGAARRQMLAGVPVDRRGVRRGPAAGHRRRAGPAGAAERIASGSPSGWAPTYEPFGAHSHYGLVVGEDELPAGRRRDPGVPRGPPALRLRRRRPRPAARWYHPGRPRRSRRRAIGAAFV